MTISPNKYPHKWILASASPRRQEILARLKMTFHVDPSQTPEPAGRPDENPHEYVIRIARLKAKEVGKNYKSGMVIAADTVVVLDGNILGKPSTREEAQGMLQSLAGRWHQVYSGVCLFDCKLRRSRAAYSCTRVHFRRLSPADIHWYLDSGEYRDKAGAYAVQGYASLFIDKMEGCYFNIVGFPVATFEKLCRKMKIDLKTQIRLPAP